jgi:hypothetical protein
MTVPIAMSSRIQLVSLEGHNLTFRDMYCTVQYKVVYTLKSDLAREKHLRHARGPARHSTPSWASG